MSHNGARLRNLESKQETWDPFPKNGGSFLRGFKDPHHNWIWYQPKPFAAWKMPYHCTFRTLQKPSISVLLSAPAGTPWWATAGCGPYFGNQYSELQRAEETLGLVDWARLCKVSQDITHTPKEASTKWNGYACPTDNDWELEWDFRKQLVWMVFQTEGHDQNQFLIGCDKYFLMEWKKVDRNAVENTKIHHL